MELRDEILIYLAGLIVVATVLATILRRSKPPSPKPAWSFRTNEEGFIVHPDRVDLQRALGRSYEVREKLGEGTFGVVFLVSDLTLNRDLAVKVLRYASKELLVRFKREATLLANLRHPNIVPIHFIGAAEGIVFMAMPRLTGETLRSAMNRERHLTLQETSRITSQVASALDQTHAAKVVHRDIKPENIFLEGQQRHTQVMDFGVAKDLAQALREGQLIATIIGTLEYMSPEQCTGDPAIDGRSDVYSLGCVVYEMLVGERPFTGGSHQEIMWRHVHEAPRLLRLWRPDCSPKTELVLQTALAKAPTDRFQSAGALAAALAGSSSA